MNADIWTRRLQTERTARNLTRCYVDVLEKLLSFRGRGGGIWPSHEALAKRADTSVRTVRRALAEGLRLGLVFWMPRHKRDGWRRIRDTNRYFLNVPEKPGEPGSRPPFPRRPSGGQIVRVTATQEKKEALQGMFREAFAAGDLLAARRNAFARGAVTPGTGLGGANGGFRRN